MALACQPSVPVLWGALPPTGVRCDAPHGWVALVPHEGAYAVGFSGAHREVSVHVDMTTEPVRQDEVAVLAEHWLAVLDAVAAADEPSVSMGHAWLGRAGADAGALGWSHV